MCGENEITLRVDMAGIVKYTRSTSKRTVSPKHHFAILFYNMFVLNVSAKLSNSVRMSVYKLLYRGQLLMPGVEITLRVENLL